MKKNIKNNAIWNEPHWIEKIYSDNSGEDFLGLRSVQGNITDYLLPGIITITPRARYYSFYSWVLHEYQARHPVGMSLAKFVKRREQVFALANLFFDVESGYGDHTSGMIGSRKLTQVLYEIGEKKQIPLTNDDYIGATYGGYGQYIGVMRSLEIIREPEDETADLELLPKSKALAQAFEKTIAGTVYYKKRHEFDTAKIIHRDVLTEYGSVCYLSGLADAPDSQPTLQTLFGLDAKHVLPDPQLSLPRLGNMAPSLGLMLDMLGQTKTQFNDNDFRRCALYGACRDFQDYSPRLKLKPVLAHWQMFQLREYYVYCLYEVWRYFLDVLKTKGPLTFEQFLNHLDGTGTARIKSTLKMKKAGALSQINLHGLVTTVLEQSGCIDKDFDAACIAYSTTFQTPLKEEALADIIYDEETSHEDCMLLSFLVLLSIYLRLRGIFLTDNVGAWNWAKEGGTRRRSMSLFMQHMDDLVQNGSSLFDFMSWIFRDYIVIQHTITALEKWRQRDVNTFHFSDNNGVYEFLRMDGNGFTASRFLQANSMLRDLGLIKFDDENVTRLSKRGKETLNAVLETLK